MKSAASQLTQIWLLLIAITCASAFTAEYLGRRDLAVAIIMAIVATKGAIIALRFMEVGKAPIGIRFYMTGWIVGTATMIAGAFWFSGA